MASIQEAPVASTDECDFSGKFANKCEETENIVDPNQKSEDDGESATAPGQSSTENKETNIPAALKRRSGVDDDGIDKPATKFVKIGDSDNHTKVVATHYNQLEEKGLAERSKSRIFFMRNFNNWIKSMLINDYIVDVKSSIKHGEPLRVLDMCCGKGGDLLKWEKAGITHLICTDIAEVSIQQCEERYKTMADRFGRNQRNNRFNSSLFSAEFFACDSTLQRLREKYQNASIELNLVSCQFAFHYCFESFKQAECMIRNAAECLKENGYFIGTIPDANEIIKRQRSADSTEFGNDLYRISFLCDANEPPLFGAKYNFELDGVVNCPEFLVHFPLLEKLAKKYGLKLIMKQRFEDYFNKNKESGKSASIKAISGQ